MAATRKQKSSLRGITQLRRALRKLPQDIKAEVQDAVLEAGTMVYRDMVAAAPRETGNLAQSIQIKRSPDKLVVRVGFVSKKAKRDGFYARFHELGTKGSPEHNIPPLPARPFIAPALDANRVEIKRVIGEAVHRAILRSKLRLG